MKPQIQRSTWLNSCLLHNCAPSGRLLAHKRFKLLGCATRRIRGLLGEALSNVGHAQDFGELCIEPLDDRLRSTGRNNNTVPKRNIHASIAEFGESRDVREEPIAFGTCGSQRPQSVIQNGWQQRRYGVEHDRNASRNDIDYSWAATSIGDVQKICAGASFTQLARQMWRTAVTRRCEGEFTRLHLREIDYVLDGLNRQRRGDRHDEGQFCQQNHW